MEKNFYQVAQTKTTKNTKTKSADGVPQHVKKNNEENGDKQPLSERMRQSKLRSGAGRSNKTKIRFARMRKDANRNMRRRFVELWKDANETFVRMQKKKDNVFLIVGHKNRIGLYDVVLIKNYKKH